MIIHCFGMHILMRGVPDISTVCCQNDQWLSLEHLFIFISSFHQLPYSECWVCSTMCCRRWEMPFRRVICYAMQTLDPISHVYARMRAWIDASLACNIRWISITMKQQNKNENKSNRPLSIWYVVCSRQSMEVRKPYELSMLSSTTPCFIHIMHRQRMKNLVWMNFECTPENDIVFIQSISRSLSFFLFLCVTIEHSTGSIDDYYCYYDYVVCVCVCAMPSIRRRIW